MKPLRLFSVLILLILAGCNSHLSNEHDESLLDSNQEDSFAIQEDSFAIQEVPVMIYDGDYCTRLLVSLENGSIIGDYDVKVQVKSNKLIWLDLPEVLNIDFDSYEPSDISEYGSAEILMEDGRVYKIQIIECQVSSDDEEEIVIRKGVTEHQIDKTIQFSSNRSWAKSNFREYFEKGDINEFISFSESDYKDLQGESEREEAKSIIKFASSFSNGDIVNLKNFEAAVNLLGLSYTVRYLGDDLSVIKFKFGSSFYYFMRNTNSSHGYSFTVVGGNGKLTLWKSSRNVSCSFLAQVNVGKIQYDDIYLQSSEPIKLCVDW